MSQLSSMAESKEALRRAARLRRRTFDGRDAASARIRRRFMEMPEVLRAEVVSIYLSVRDEVGTRELADALREAGHRVAIPVCEGSGLLLFDFRSWDELEPGPFGLLEPNAACRASAGRWLDFSRPDVFLVPGLAFDRQGGRLGYGRGHYDRSLPARSPEAWLVGAAFACQMVPGVPREEHDLQMHVVLTEDERIDVVES